MFIQVFIFLIGWGYLTPTLVTNAQTVAPNDVISTRWQRSLPGYFGYSFVQWEEVEMCRPSFIFVNGSATVQRASERSF